MQRWPGSQSREVSQALWQRRNAQTKGESQSVLRVQPAASFAVLGCSLSEQAEATTSERTSQTSNTGDLSRCPIVSESALLASGSQGLAFGVFVGSAFVLGFRGCCSHYRSRDLANVGWRACTWHRTGGKVSCCIPSG